MRAAGLLGAALALALAAGCAAPAPIAPLGDATPARERAPAHALRVVVEDEPVELRGPAWYSPWVEPAFPFDELLPSWNVRLPEGAAFRVDVQLDSEESPWLDLGGWGEWPAAQRAATRFEGGAVAIDVVELEGDARRARFRLRTRGLPAGGAATLERLTVCTTRSALHALRADFGDPPAVPLLPVPMRHQGREDAAIAHRICSPTSVAMALAHAGVARPTAEVAAALYDAEHDIYGNWNRAVQGAFLFGVPGYLLRVDDWPQAARLLQEGTPLVISIAAAEGQLGGAPYAQTAGHLLVLAGFDGEGHALCLDPASPVGQPAPRRYALAELEVCWLRRGGVAYRFGVPPAGR